MDGVDLARLQRLARDALLPHEVLVPLRPEEARAAFVSAVAHLQATLGPDHPDTQIARELAQPELARR